MAQPDSQTPSNRRPVEGYILTYGNLDYVGDIIERGAVKTIPSYLPMYWYHDPAEIVGEWTEFSDDEHGLYAKGHIFTDVSRGADAAALIDHGVLDGLSIGFRNKKSEVRRGTRHLMHIDLAEASLTAIPANDQARMGVDGAAKTVQDNASDVSVAADEVRALLELADILRSAGRE